MNRTLLAVTVAASFATPALVRAQTPAETSSPIGRSIARLAAAPDSRPIVAPQWQPMPTPRRPTGHHRRSLANPIIRGVLGGIGGFYAGGMLGAALEPNCRCDDPGLNGFIIGAPIGAVAGSVFGAWLMSR